MDNETRYRNALMWAFDRLKLDGGMTPREQRYTFDQIGNVLLGRSSPASSYVAPCHADSVKLEGRCKDGDRCPCGGDTPEVRATCPNWIKI